MNSKAWIKQGQFLPQKLSYGKSRLHAKENHDNPSINMEENFES